MGEETKRLQATGALRRDSRIRADGLLLLHRDSGFVLWPFCSLRVLTPDLPGSGCFFWPLDTWAPENLLLFLLLTLFASEAFGNVG